MTLTIGRASSLRPANVVRSGDSVSIDGTIIGADANEIDARRQQMLGLLDPDEDVVPITWSVDPTLDGYYRIGNVSVPRRGIERSGVAAFAADLTRVAGGYARAQFETVVQQVLRTNDHAVTIPDRVDATAYSPTAYTWAEIEAPAAITGSSVATVNTEDGVITNYFHASGVGSLFGSSSWRQYLKPADYYKGGARLEVQYGGTWYPVHGRQVPLATAGNWRISNGLVRVSPSSSGGAGRFTIQNWRSGASTYSGREFYIGQYNAGTTTWLPRTATGDASGFVTPVVLVNTPNLVVVRCQVGAFTTDFLVRGGDSWVEVTGSQSGFGTTLSNQWAAGLSTIEGTTAFTGGIRATADDANGLRYLIAAPRTVTTDAANARMRITATTYDTMTFAYTSSYVTGSTSSGGGTDTGTRNLFLAIRSEVRRVIAR